ncbi:MAG: hypothetical protein M1553_10610 [Firmicutes bacterium]|nr:hypothetical protein [Bacillota bacterium]
MSQRVANFFSDLRRRQQLLLPVWFEDGQVIILDQTRLPFQEHHLALRHVNEVAVAIKAMQIRGSGAIALAGAWGLYHCPGRRLGPVPGSFNEPVHPRANQRSRRPLEEDQTHGGQPAKDH